MLGDTQVLGDLGQIGALMGGEREAAAGGEALGQVLDAAEDPLRKAPAEDGGKALLLDIVHQGGPLDRLAAGGARRAFAIAVAESGLVPEAPTAQAQEKRRHPGVRSLAHQAPGLRQGAVELAVLQQLAEEAGHGGGHGGHADLALHGQDGGHPGGGQARGQGGLGAGGLGLAVGLRGL